jgi:hypothetical protein
MTEPSKKPHKRKLPKQAAELPDDELILKLFPKKVVKEVNRQIGHKPKSGPLAENDTR